MEYQKVSADELFAAIHVRSQSVVRELIARDNTVAQIRDDSGLPALLRCLFDWDLEMLEILLAARTELDIFEAAALGHKESVEQLLQQRPELVHTWSADGSTPLHLACFYGHQEVVAMLLSQGADPSGRMHDQRGATPLHEAAATGQLKIARTLLACGAKINAADSEGWTALHLASARGDG